MRARAADSRNDAPSGAERARAVEAIFSLIAGTYDLMNDVISLGMHRVAKRRAVAESGAAAGDCVLDLGGGTGDIALRLGGVVTSEGLVVLADASREMIRVARRRLARRLDGAPAACVAADALALPFGGGAFDRVLVSFGLRNFADIPVALSEIRRVLKPGGALVVLDFSTPRNRFVRATFQFYLDRVVPFVAGIVTGEARGYRYLAASVRAYPGAAALREMMAEAGFRVCSHRSMMGGALALHRGRKA